MATGDNIRQLGETLSNMGKAHVKVQTAWVTVKSVDWGSKTMVATGVLDGLDYNDVLLGLGNVYRKPVIGSKCLVGLIENKDAAAFLLEAEDVAEMITTSGTSVLTVTPQGFKVERAGESLTSLIKDLLNAQIAATYTNGAGTTSPANNLTTFQQILARVDNLLK